jgi:hypothetical protein
MDAGDWARYGLARERLLDVTDGIRHLSENERRKSPRSSRQYPRLRDAILAYVQAFYELIPTARNYLTEAATTDAILQVVWCIWECNLPRLECPEEAVFAHTVLWRRPEVSLLQRVEDVRDAVRTIDRWLSDSSATATECRRGRGGAETEVRPTCGRPNCTRLGKCKIPAFEKSGVCQIARTRGQESRSTAGSRPQAHPMCGLKQESSCRQLVRAPLLGCSRHCKTMLRAAISAN